MEQRAQLHPAFGADKGVELVDDDEAQPCEEPREVRSTANEKRFEGLGRDEDHAARRLARRLLPMSAKVAVPANDGNVERLEQRLEAPELIVDEGLERTDIEGMKAGF